LGLNLLEHTGGVVFTFLNIRLIKWMNAEHVSCDSSGEFPAEEFSAQIVSITQVQSEDWVPGVLECGEASIQRGIPVALEAKTDKQSIGSIGRRGSEGLSCYGYESCPFFAGAFR